MTDTGADRISGPTPDTALRDAEAAARPDDGPMLAADGTPLKRSLARALRRQKLRALLLISPLLIFVLVTFVAPILDMLFRSVENRIVEQTLPRTVVALEDWDMRSGELPGPDAFDALAKDFAVAVEYKAHTRLGSRLNYEETGISSLFRKSGRKADEIGEPTMEVLEDALGKDWLEPSVMLSLLGSEDWEAEVADWAAAGEEGAPPAFRADRDARELFPETTRLYQSYAALVRSEGDSYLDEDVWPIVYYALGQELRAADPAALGAFPDPDGLFDLPAARAALEAAPPEDPVATFLDIDEDWGDVTVWQTIKLFSSPITAGYFLAAIDRELTPDGVKLVEEDVRIYGKLFLRTMWMSLAITVACILLGYPVAYLLASLPLRTANVLMILVLLPFWTSLLVRTSAWKVLLQQQGVINDVLVWIGLVADDNRLELINNATGTVIAMTHILLPFMILPLYSVMKTINPSYVRAAKSLGATPATAFWRVYFPNSVPGIGAGSILVFILSIGYYITPEIVGGTKGVFISNRIAYHISESLNWGLAAALGSILLIVVLMLYWLYDRIVGIDNVKLGG